MIAALVVSAALLGSTWMLGRSLDDAAEELAAFRSSVSDLRDAMKQAAQAAPAAGQRPGGLDSNRRYEIKLVGAPMHGNERAPVTIIEWSDFQCPFCAKVIPTLKQLQTEYGERVRFAYKHLPLAFHPKAPAAHAAAEAAHRQGKFWEMHERIFDRQQEMAPEKYVEWAKELGLDVERFKADMASAEVKRRVDADSSEAAALGVTGTPTFFVNGRFLQGARPIEAFKQLIDEELARKGG